MRYKCFIVNFNRLSLPVQLAYWCFNNGLDPVIVDNCSDYPSLLQYYDQRCPFQVIRMNENYGHLVVWKADLLARLGVTGKYIVTDPDLDLTNIPLDFMSVLEEGLRRHPVSKCGFSLEINGVKNKETIAWETPFWQKPLDNMYFDAPVDTTFALYRGPEFSYSAVRTNRPYTAIHIPWSYDYVKDLPEDEQYYYKTQNEDTASHTHVKK